jgi:hypothetical protein
LTTTTVGNYSLHGRASACWKAQRHAKIAVAFNPDAYSPQDRGQFDLEIKISVGLDILIRHTRNRDRAVAVTVAAWGMLSINSPLSRQGDRWVRE